MFISAEEALANVRKYQGDLNDKFYQQHKEFVDTLNERIRTVSTAGQSYLFVRILQNESFPQPDIDFLLTYLKALKFMIRTLDKNDDRFDPRFFSFDLYWKESGKG